jgi:hypothetical protein
LFTKKVKRKMKGPTPRAQREERGRERDEERAKREEGRREPDEENVGRTSTLEAARTRAAGAGKNVVE